MSVEFDLEKQREAYQRQHRLELQDEYDKNHTVMLAKHNEHDDKMYAEAVRWRETMDKKDQADRAIAQSLVKSIIDKKSAEDDEYQRKQALRKLAKKMQSQREVHSATTA